MSSGFSVDQSFCIDSKGNTALVRNTTLTKLLIHSWREGTCIAIVGNDAILEIREKPRHSKDYWRLLDDLECSFEFTDIEERLIENLKNIDHINLLPMNYYMPDKDAVDLINYYCRVRDERGYTPKPGFIIEISPRFITNHHYNPGITVST